MTSSWVSAQGKKKDFPCSNNHSAGAELRAARKMKAAIPNIRHSASMMTALALEVQKETGKVLCRLPFCDLFQAELLGAPIDWNSNEPKPYMKDGAFLPLEAIESIAPSPDSENVRRLLQTCSSLKSQGKSIIAEISGPLTLLNSMTDLMQFLKRWRKEDALIPSILNRLNNTIREYAASLIRSGTDVLSFADPIGHPNILGPACSQMLTDSFFLPFFQEMRTLLKGTAVMQICPGNARMLTDLRRARWIPIRLDPPMAYEQACLACRGKAELLGQTCIHSVPEQLLNETVHALYLNT